MAAAISSVGEGRSSRAMHAPVRSVNARSRSQPPSLSSSSTSFSATGTSGRNRGVSLQAANRSMAGVGGGGGGGSGVWTSILSIAAAALPPSLLPFTGTSTGETQSHRQRDPPDGSQSSQVQRAHRATIASTAASMASSSGRRVASGSGNHNAYSLLPLTLPSAEGGAAVADNPVARAASHNGELRASREARDEVVPGNDIPAAPNARSTRGHAVAAVVAGSPPPIRRNTGRSAARGVRSGARGRLVAEVVSPVPVAASTQPVASTGKVHLEGGGTVYTCSTCRAHLATRDHIVSECFHGQGGRAFLFERCVNVTAGRLEHRLLLTGMHIVADISCSSCGSELGWKYEEAAKESQKYKEGKFILERCAVIPEGSDGDGYIAEPSNRHFDDRYSDDRFGTNRYDADDFDSQRYDSYGGFVSWGMDNAPLAASGRW